MKRKFGLDEIIKKEELITGLLILVFVFLFDYNCLFKSLFHLPCAGCGITRSFEYLLRFDVMGSLRYNILAFPIVLYFLVLFTLRISDAIKGTHKADALEKPIMSPTNIIFLVLLVSVSWATNIIRGL